MIAAIVNAAGFGFLSLPGSGPDVDLGSGIKPERAPHDRSDQEQGRGDEQAPKRASTWRKRDISHPATPEWQFWQLSGRVDRNQVNAFSSKRIFC